MDDPPMLEPIEEPMPEPIMPPPIEEPMPEPIMPPPMPVRPPWLCPMARCIARSSSRRFSRKP